MPDEKRDSESEDSKNIFGKAIPQLIHDIRNPLNIIIGFSSILQFDDSINDEVKSYIKSILISGMHVEQILSNIDYYLMDNLDLAAQRINISSEIQTFKNQNSDTINDKEIVLNVDTDSVSDVNLPQGILSRIIDNLFQFSIKGLKSIFYKEVNILISRKDDSRMQIYYSDSSTPVVINGDYFTFDEILKSKRGLSPLFSEKIVKEFGGTIKYLYGKTFSQYNEQNSIKTKCQHGFIVEMPL